MRSNKLYLVLVLLIFTWANKIYAQAIFTPWGNIKSIYLDGEELQFETSLRSVQKTWQAFSETEKYNWEKSQKYWVEGKNHYMEHFILGTSIDYKNKMTELDKNSVLLETKIHVNDDFQQIGTFFCFKVPGNEFENGKIDFFSKNKLVASLNLQSAKKNELNELVRLKSDKIIFRNNTRTYTIQSDKTYKVFLRSDFEANPSYRNDPWPEKRFANSDVVLKHAGFQLYFTLIDGDAKKNDVRNAKFNIHADGVVNKADVALNFDVKNPGQRWDGLSGNFRWQFPDRDPQVIEYCLQNLQTEMGRISMWWELWHTNEQQNPAEQARSGKLNTHLKQQIELAQKLQKNNIPIILTVWNAPDWAIDKNKNAPKGVHLNQQKMDDITNSFVEFIQYIKQDYGVDVDLFSFNEPDCGVEIFQTPEEHAIFNKAIGAAFKKAKLRTKILVGDTGHGTAKANEINQPTVADESIHQYIGAVGFHTWHGCTTTDLIAWRKTADALNAPLMVIEGGENSAAHRYANVFLQPWFQLSEIDLYVRCCAVGQVSTIMQWQYTSDYSLLLGNGLYNDNGELRPTQRFWNLKQLSLTPKAAFWIPANISAKNITCAVAADIANQKYSIHLVNNGPERTIKLTDLPKGIEVLHLYVTDATRGMEQTVSIAVKNSTASFKINALSYTTLVNFK